MLAYLRCLKAKRGVNENECRMLSKEYLQCRMERNLMAPDEMKNLGYAEEQQTPTVPVAEAAAVTGDAKTVGGAGDGKGGRG
ncbi:Cytochrome c oxidase assembly protein cox19 [Elasticomyces elasticus]|nr:Cytochrome c oxidase assembly protein cox19 [Elasticomyces elasticus]